MDFAPCFNTYNNINYRQKSQTLQPNDKQFLLNKYFASQMAQLARQDRSNYANVFVDQEEPAFLLHHHQPRHLPRHSLPHHHQQPLHNRSHSQHYYHTMYPVNDLNNYCNISTIGQAIKPARTRPQSPITNEQPSPLNNPVAQLDCITVMQVCNELGNNIDSAPPVPNGRTYSILRTRDGLFKVAFPQTRVMKSDYADPHTGTVIKSGESVSVLGPSKEDRSLFTVCYQDKHMDLPHQLTRAPQIKTRWP